MERRTENLTAGAAITIRPDVFRYLKIIQASGILTFTTPLFPLPVTLKENQSHDFLELLKGANLTIVSTDTETVIFDLTEKKCHGKENPSGGSVILGIQGVWAWMTSHAQSLWKLVTVGMALNVGGSSYRVVALQTKDGVGLSVREYTDTTGCSPLPTTFPAYVGVNASGRGLVKCEVMAILPPAPAWTLGTLTVIDENANVLPIWDMNGARIPSALDPTAIGTAFLVDCSMLQTLQFAPDVAYDGETFIDIKTGAKTASIQLVP